MWILEIDLSVAVFAGIKGIDSWLCPRISMYYFPFTPARNLTCLSLSLLILQYILLIPYPIEIFPPPHFPHILFQLSNGYPLCLASVFKIVCLFVMSHLLFASLLPCSHSSYGMTLSEKTCVGKIAFLISFQIPAVLSFVHFLKTSVCEGWVLAAELMNPDLQELRTEQEKIVSRHKVSIMDPQKIRRPRKTRLSETITLEYLAMWFQALLWDLFFSVKLEVKTDSQNME